jgi:clan AA aspartic protease
VITGIVTSGREAVVRLLVRGPNEEQFIDAVIDTGFNGLLTMSIQVIENLALPFAATTRALLADGREAEFELFEATVMWDEENRQVAVLATDGDALLGMSMLSGYRLTVDVQPEGTVRIQRLP